MMTVIIQLHSIGGYIDRFIYMGNAERQKSLDHAGGVSHGLPNHQRQHRQRRAIHAGLPLDQPQQ
jgi:hypothetical protein